MNNKSKAAIIYIVSAMLLLSSCGSYKPPYERGYDEGYEDGYAAAGGDVSQMPEKEEADIEASKVEEAGEAEEAEASQDGEETETREKKGLSGMISSKKEEKNDAPSEDGGEITEADGGEETPAAETKPEVQEVTVTSAEAETEGSGTQESNVLGEGSEPTEGSSGGSGGIPEGRIISADAVNEALFTHPEVIDGLRDIYPDVAIFGEYVGDSETNLLHKVNGPHFGELTYNRVVVYDGSRSIDDILSEGFFSKCSCCDQ